MNWTRIFKAGTHISASGKSRTWSHADLDRVVTSYDPAKREAPLVLGHPKTNAPAFGWVEKVRRAGDYLEASFKQVPDQLKQAVKAGAYKHKSISLFPDGTLRHVGILGAAQPAVPGLGEVNFEAEENFTTYNFNEEARVTIEEMQAKLDAEKAARQAAEAKADEFKAQADGFETKFKDAEKSKQDLEAQFADQQAKAEKEIREGRFNDLVQEGKALPAEKERVMAFAAAISREEEDFCFSESEGKKPLEDHFWKFMADRKGHELFSEFRAHEGDDKAAEPFTLNDRV
jgi:hypothetical protein